MRRLSSQNGDVATDRDVRFVCPSHKYGSVNHDVYRVRCTGKFCRGPDGTVTFHTFRLDTGELIRTDHVPYRNPRELLGEGEQR